MGETERTTLSRGLLPDEEAWNHLRWTMKSAAVVERLIAMGDSSAESVMRRSATEDDLKRRIELTVERLRPIA